MSVYSEYLVEYDNSTLTVYVSGLDEDGYWWEITANEEVNNPEEFAEGYAQSMRDHDKFVTVLEVISDDKLEVLPD